MKPPKNRLCNRCGKSFLPTMDRRGGLLFCDDECLAERNFKKLRPLAISPPLPLAITSLENLEDISWVLTYRLTGVYFLQHENKVVYVGKSINVLSRIAAGHIDKIFDNVGFLECPLEKLADTEAFWIRKFRPKYNKAIY